MDIAFIGPRPHDLDLLQVLDRSDHTFHLRTDERSLEQKDDEPFMTAEALLSPMQFKRKQLSFLENNTDILHFFDPWYAVMAQRSGTTTMLSIHDSAFSQAVDDYALFRLIKIWLIRQGATNAVDYVVTDGDEKVAAYYIIMSDLFVLSPQGERTYTTVYESVLHDD